MTTLRHPHIAPPLVIEVEDEHVPGYTEAGWLPHEPSTPDPEPSGDEGLDSPKEKKK